ncbi:MAG: hypothetical protein WC202_10490 [Desulfobacterales bacterium]|jgi:hypothetical protein
MQKTLEPKSIEQLLAEADELIQQIRSDAIKDMEEERLLEFEKQAQELKRIKDEVQSRKEKKEAAKIGSGAEGMHEAIQDIVKAMKNYFS